MFKKSSAAKTNKSYKEGSCILSSSLNTKGCDADYHQMFLYKKEEEIKSNIDQIKLEKCDSCECVKACPETKYNWSNCSDNDA